MTDHDILEMIAIQVAKLTSNMDELTSNMDRLTSNMDRLTDEVGGIKTELGSVKTELGSIKTELGSVKAIVIKIEHEHGQKLGALFDGYTQLHELQTQMSETLADHTVRLERIEAKLAEHDIRINVLDKTKAEKRKVR